VLITTQDVLLSDLPGLRVYPPLGAVRGCERERESTSGAPLHEKVARPGVSCLAMECTGQDIALGANYRLAVLHHYFDGEQKAPVF